MSKYYLIKTEEDCVVGNCGGTKDILELDCYTKDFVELTHEELLTLAHEIINDNAFKSARYKIGKVI